jgi:hypothetical protein
VANEWITQNRENFVVCGFVAPYYQIFTITLTRILAQNGRCWSLCKSTNVSIAERHLQEGPVLLLLWQWRSSKPTETRPRSFSFKRGKEKKWNRLVRDQVSTEGVAKRRPVVLRASLGQAQSNVQGRCRVATASSCAKAQDAYDELNCVNGEGSPCSGACLIELRRQGRIPFEWCLFNRIA